VFQPGQDWVLLQILTLDADRPYILGYKTVCNFKVPALSKAFQSLDFSTHPVCVRAIVTACCPSVPRLWRRWWSEV